MSCLSLDINGIDPNFSVAAFIEFWKETPLNEPRVFETNHLHKDGTLIPVEVSGQKFLIGEEVFFFGIARNISERKIAEKALKRSNLIIESTSDAVITTDPNGMVLYWNAGAEDLYGYRREEVIGKPISLIYKDDDLHILESMITRLLQGDNIPNIEVTCIDKNHNDVHILLSLMTLKDENGNVSELVGITKNINELKVAEQNIRRSRAELASILESTEHAISARAKDGTLTYYNQSFEKGIREIFGKKVYPGMDMLNLVPESERQVWEKRWSRVLNGEIVRFELVLTLPDGQQGFYHMCFNPIWVDHEVTGFTEFVQDITEQKQAQQAIAESEERYRTLFEQANDAIFLADPDTGILLDVNQAAEELLGYNQVELVGEHQSFIHPPEEVEDYRKKFKQSTSSPGMQFMEMEVVNKHGRRIPVEISSGGTLNLSGQKVHMGIFRNITERQNAEEALRLNEERMKLALDSVSDAVWDWRVDTGEVYFSSRWYTMLGYEPYEFTQEFETWRKLLHPEDLPWAEKEVAAHVESGDPFNIEFRMCKKGGGWKWILGRGKVVERDDNGSAMRMLGTHMDITERKISEAALIESERKWRNILVNTPQIGISLDPSAKVIFVNDHFLELTGWDEQDVVGKDWFDMFIPDQIREEVRQVFITVMSQKDTHGFSSYENEIMTKTGELRNVAWSNVPTKDPQGNIVDVTCLGIDLTERTRAEENLRASEANYRLLVENQTDLVVKVGLDGKFLFVSPSYCKLFGKTEAELIGHKFMPLVHEDDRDITAKVMEGLFSPPHTAYVEQRALTRDGWRWLAWADSAVLNQDNKVVEIIGVGRDITDRKQAEEEREHLQAQLAQAQKMDALGTLASGIAHDFNNVLAAIMGYSELALDDLAEDQPVRQDIEQITKAASKAKSLVRQILTFSRKAEANKEPLSINKVINEAVSILGRTLPKMVRLELQLQDELKPVKADSQQIEQVLVNLATNAVDAISDEGQITIATEFIVVNKKTCDVCHEVFSGEYVLLSFQDTGAGISEQNKAKIFDPFYTTKRIGEGTGLGLSTVFGIVTGHGGHINYQSQPGRGTKFSIYLPVVEQKISEKIISTTERVNKLQGNETILVVDDEETVRDIAKRLLGRSGYQVMLADSGENALDIYHEHYGNIDVVLMDLGMPGMGGKSCLEKIKQAYPDAKVLIASGYIQYELTDELESLGAIGMVSKPYRKHQLLKQIREVLDE
jgi:two-component system cell cycle sensor histidine kinase/response regulator CckA